MSDVATERTGRASSMDVHVGTRIKLRRTQMGLSQEKLGDAIKVTFQQIQKYERGVNRVGASRLFDLSVVLNVPVGFFYDDMPGVLAAERGGEPSVQAARRATGFAEQGQATFDEGTAPMVLTMAIDSAELVRVFEQITNPLTRRLLLDMARSLAGSGSLSASRT